MKGFIMKRQFTGLMVLLSALFFSLSGCTSSNQIPDDTSSATSFYVPENPPRAQYELETAVEVKEKTVHVSGSERIVFTNTSENPISAIALHSFGGDHSVSIGGINLSPVSGTPAAENIHFFALPESIAPGEELQLDIQFNLETKTRENGDVSLQRFYPKLWWDGIPTQDVFRVKLDIPADFTAAVSGRLNPETGFYENPGVTTNFGLFLFKDINVEEREAAGIKVKAFFPDEGRECAMLCLETAVDVIGFYKDVHGFFPFPSLTIIPGGSGPWGGYPFASALVVIHGMQVFEKAPELHWKWITAHEIGHQYWGETVMSRRHNNYPDSWLMIGMGIFADRMYTEFRQLGDDKHTGLMDRYLKGVKEHFDTTADAPESLARQQKYDRNNILIHGKGYSIVSALRHTLGEKTFKRIYLRCTKEYNGKRMSYHELRLIAEEESGQNLRWFFDQWVRSPQYLCYNITSSESRLEGDTFVTDITVEAMGDSMLMPVEVKAEFADGTTQTAKASRFFRTQIITFESQAELEKAVLDPQNQLAMLEEPLPILPDELPEQIRELPYNNAWLKGLELYHIAMESGFNDPSGWFKLGMVVFEGGLFKEAFSCFEKILTLDARDLYDFMAVTWMGNVRDAQNRRDEALNYYRQALEMAEDHGAMRHDQFGIQTSKEWIKQRLDSSYNWNTIVKK
jgi:tetratricopeptide (TPR) repeat protein